MTAAANDVIKRVHYKLYTLFVLRKDMPTYCAIRLYKAMILPLIDYSNFCLTPCPEKTKTKIQRLQNKALRICFRSVRGDRTSDLHSRARLGTVNKHSNIDILKIVHTKIYSFDTLSPEFNIISNLSSSSVATRLRDAPTIQLERPSSGKTSKSLLYYGSNLWNSLPTSLHNTSDPTGFKSAIKRWVYSQTPP